MKKFSLSAPTEVLITNVKPAIEMHGKTRVHAVDVKVRLTTSNLILDELKGADFRHALYTRPEAAGQPPQESLEGVENATDTPLARLKGVEPLHLEDELTGYMVTIGLGIGRPESGVVLPSCKLSRFVIDMLNGGSCAIDFNIRAHVGIGKKQYGELCVLLDSKVSLQLEPPEEKNEQAQLEEPEKDVGTATTKLKDAMRANDTRARKAERTRNRPH